MANAQLADAQGLAIIPVINKVDLPSADIPRVSNQIEEILAIPAEDAIHASGKSGIGVEDILEAVVHRLPQPRWGKPPKAPSPNFRQPIRSLSRCYLLHKGFLRNLFFKCRSFAHERPKENSD